MLKNVWSSKELTTTAKLQIFRSKLKSVLFYGAETWRMTKKTLSKIQTFLDTCLRHILKINCKDKVTSEELWERANEEPVELQIRRRKWGWIGHSLHKPASNITIQALMWNPQGKQKKGRPRNSWRRDVEKEMREAAGLDWTEIGRRAQNQIRWRKLINGLSSAGGEVPK